MGDRLEDLEDHDWKIAGSCFACLISSRSQFRGRSELTSIVCSGRGMPDFISTVSTSWPVSRICDLSCLQTQDKPFTCVGQSYLRPASHFFLGLKKPMRAKTGQRFRNPIQTSVACRTEVERKSCLTLSGIYASFHSIPQIYTSN